MDKIKNFKYKKYTCPPIVILAVVVLLELLVFNFRHWQMIGNKPVLIDDWSMSENISVADNLVFRVDNVESNPYIEITGLDMPVNSAYFDFVDLLKGETGVYELNYVIELTDQGNAIPYTVPERTFFRWVTKTHYTTLNPYGNVHSFRVYFTNVNEGDYIRVNSFILNPKFDLQVSKKRMAFLFVLLVILYVIRPKSSLYEYKVTDKFKGKYIAIVGVLVLEIILFFSVSHLNKWYENVPEGGNTQFMQLAEAIVDRGEVFLAAKAPEGMADMDDPYDAVLRRSLFGENSDIGDMSDTGFYNGKYFVYFGIAPILTFYVPKYALTGVHAVTRNVVFMLCVLCAAAILFLLYEICIRYFDRLSFILYLMFSVLFTFGAGQLLLAICPDFYTVPILYALACAMAGLGFWIKALNIFDSNVNSETGKSSANRRFILCLTIGSFLLALTASSRPQFLIVSFLAIPLFWNMVSKERKLLSAKSVGTSVAFILPYVLVAAGVMYYNYIRFGNVFDFGANYNLCYNNMPYRGWHIDRILHATVGYLFYPCTVTNQFPFFELSSYTSRYMGITADETLLGGIIYNNLYLVIVFFIFELRKFVKSKEALWIAILGPAFALIVMITDANMAGVLPRYYADFSWGFMISAFLLIGYLYVSVSEKHQYVIRCIFCALFVVTSVRFFLMPFYGNYVHSTNLMAYNVVKNLVEFWY